MLGRRSIVCGSIIAVAIPASADPGAPPLDAIHLRREDAQRAAEHVRPSLTQPGPLPAGSLDTSQITPPAPPGADASGADSDKARSAGRVLLGVAAVSALVGGPLYLIGGANEQIDGRSSDAKSFGAVLIVTAALSGGFGAALYLSSGPPVRVTPVVATHAVGLSISGSL